MVADLVIYRDSSCRQSVPALRTKSHSWLPSANTAVVASQSSGSVSRRRSPQSANHDECRPRKRWAKFLSPLSELAHHFRYEWWPMIPNVWHQSLALYYCPYVICPSKHRHSTVVGSRLSRESQCLVLSLSNETRWLTEVQIIVNLNLALIDWKGLRLGEATTVCKHRTRLSTLSGMVRQTMITEPELVPIHNVGTGLVSGTISHITYSKLHYLARCLPFLAT